MYSLWVAPEAIKELGDTKRYPAKVARQLLIKILELSVNPRPQDSIQIETGFRVDSGEYRIFYELDHRAQMVKIYLVGKRGDDVPADTTADNSPAAVAEAVPAEGASGVVETTVEASAEGSVDVGAPKTE